MSKNLQDHTKMYNSIKQGNLHFTETIKPFKHGLHQQSTTSS